MPFKCLTEQHELDEEIKKAGRKLVVVAFSSQGCGPCRGVVPTMEELCKEMPDILFYKVEVDKDDDFCKRYSISGVPKFCFYRCEKELYNFQGGNMAYFKKCVHELRFERKAEDQQCPYV
ncbi:thioredoxin-like [Gastrophryne carolinensis]